MRKTLHEIHTHYNIPPGTLRSAISRGQIEADKVGGINFIDDEGDSFQRFLVQYRSREAVHTVSSTAVASEMRPLR